MMRRDKVMLFLLLVASCLVASSSAQSISPVCKQDLSSILNDIIQVAQEISAAQHDCSNPNATSCVPDIDNIIATFGNLTIQITDVVKDCFGGSGNSTLCAKTVLAVVADLEKVTADATAAVKACAVNPKGDDCVLDLQQVSGDATKAIVDLSGAIAICSGANQMSLFDLLRARQSQAGLRTMKKK